MRVVVMLLVVVGAVASARADAPDVGVVVVGEGALQKDVRHHVQDWVRARGYVMVAAPLSKDATNTFDNCFVLEDTKCARGVFDARSRSASLVYVGVDADLTFTTYWFTKDQDPIGDKHPCPGCTKEAWQKLLDDELGKLAAAHPELPVTKRPSPPSKVLPILLLGTGIAAMAAGGVFIYYGSIGGADQKYVYPTSTPIGIALGAVGAGAAIGGVILLKQAGSSDSAPVASVGPGHAYVGWVTRF
jgi:hypothetical protein